MTDRPAGPPPSDEANASMNHPGSQGRRAGRPARGWAAAAVAALALATAGADGPDSAVPSDPMFTAQRVDGTTVTGRLRGLDVRGGVALAVDDKERVVTVPGRELDKLTREGSPALTAGEGRMLVLFPDGDRLHRCAIGPAREAAIDVKQAPLGSLSIPLDAVLGLVFAPPADPDALQALTTRVRDEPRSAEVLWLTNGDRLAGGLLGIDDRAISVGLAAGKSEVDRAGVVALGFDPKLVDYPRPAGPHLELTLVDGSRLGVSSARVEGGHVLATTRYGRPIRLPVGELALVHTRDGPVVYLSDLTPQAEKTVGYIGPTRPSRANLAVDGRPLRLGGKAYDRGIGTQSRSYVAYRLDPGVKRLRATVGVDDRAGPLGSVVFRVIVDREVRFESPPMSVRDTPRALDLDLDGAKTLVLVTDFGERGEVRDHGDWAEARLIR